MSIIDPDLSLAAIMLIVACEAVLLTFLLLHQPVLRAQVPAEDLEFRLYPCGRAVVVLLGVAVLDLYNYDALILANLLTLGVLAVFGTRLFRIMTGVTK